MAVPDAGAKQNQCVIKAGECVPLTPDIAGCKFEAGACVFVQSSPVLNKGEQNMALPPGFPPPVAPKKHAAHAPVHAAAPVKEEVVAEEKPAAPAAPVLPALPALPTAASVAQPAGPSIPGLPPGFVSSPLGVAAMAVGALTTGAAWKFWNNRAKLKSAEKMKQLEIEKSSPQNEEQKKKCEGTTVAFEKFKGETDSKLNEIISKLGPIIEAMDPINQRLAALEKSGGKSKKKSFEEEDEVEAPAPKKSKKPVAKEKAPAPVAKKKPKKG